MTCYYAQQPNITVKMHLIKVSDSGLLTTVTIN